MTDQERERERAIRELARLLGPVTTLKDPEAAAAKFMDWLYANNFRWVAPTPGITPVTPNPDAYERGAPLAREALHRKDTAVICDPCSKPGHTPETCRNPATCPCAHKGNANA